MQIFSKKYGLLLILVFQICLLPRNLHAKISRQEIQSLFEKESFAGLHTAAKEFYLSDDEKLAVAIINLARFYPKDFIKEILTPAFADTSEAEVAGLMARLRSQKSTFPLMPAFSLYKSALVHAKEMGSTGHSGHKGSDGKNYSDRIAQYFSAPTEFHENYYQGSGDPVDVVLQMLMGKGELGIKYRENILSGDLHYIGISIQPHRTQCTNVVIDFAKKPALAASNYQKKRDKTEVYWRDCPTGTKVNAKRKTGGLFFGNLFGGKNR